MDVNLYIKSVPWNLGLQRAIFFNIAKSYLFLAKKDIFAIYLLVLWWLKVHKLLVCFPLAQGNITFGNRGSNVGSINTSI